MQRLWSIISTTFLIKCHWFFLLYWIEYSFPSNLTPSSSHGVLLCWQKHNCPHFEKEDNMNETEAFIKITQLCGTIVFLFKVREIMLLSTQLIQWEAVRWKKNPPASSLLAGGKVYSTFWKWHCLRKIALQSKRLIHIWWTWCQILGKEYAIQYTAKNQWYSIKNAVEITDQNRCILFGPPCIMMLRRIMNQE